jgi:hypothetical protein
MSSVKRKREEERLAFVSPGKKTVAPPTRRPVVRRPLSDPEPEISDDEVSDVGNVRFHIPVGTSLKSKVLDLLDQFLSHTQDTSLVTSTDDCEEDSAG